MKEGIQFINIEPLVGHLNFIGPAKEPTTTDHSQILKGNIILKLNKSMKAKTMTVKFKGHSQVHNYPSTSEILPQQEISLPLLPKLKTKVLSKSTIYPVGEHIIPWELEIPNIYPRSFLAHKRGSVQYKVELKISLGINKKAITASHPIIIHRHLIASQELVALIHTNKYEHTTNKFQYEIEGPSIICVEQDYFPITVKCNKPVKFIYTQLIQTEIYRCRNISKAEADMAITASKKNSTIVGGQTYESFKNGDSGLSKFFKRIQPVTLNTIDQDHQLLPLLLLHDLGSSVLTPAIESPLVAIYHQLEVTFNFGGHELEEIRAKIPVLVSSVPDSIIKHDKTKKKYEMEIQLHKSPVSYEVIDTSSNSSKKAIHRSTMDESVINTMKDSFVGLPNEKTLKKALSDQNLQQPKFKEIHRRSITPPPPPKPNMLDTKLANALESSSSIVSPITPSRPTLIDYSKPDDPVLQPPTETFVGLLPPPRRARKKEMGNDVSYGRAISRSSNSRFSATGSRSTSPISIHNTPIEYNMHSHLSSTDSFISTPLLSPPPPTTPRTMIRLNQSKSSCTNAGSNYATHYKRRSNSIDNGIHNEDYSKSVTSHYFCAELPPIPPAITRQKLPSIPAVEGKEEHRKTRMYYEDESDEEEVDDADKTKNN
ncbi:hypothetical protein MFLAVUS_007291 [Mucor flavus]|uniref:Arrestin C-terminal-like domain-containing protein n=1 Tax=Mucor flavus TaxID=439312 RepID=A0ABP9Z3W9_9FUNG